MAVDVRKIGVVFARVFFLSYYLTSIANQLQMSEAALRLELVHALSSVAAFSDADPFLQSLHAIDTIITLKMASNWRYNSLKKSVSISCHYKYDPSIDKRKEFLHDLDGSLIGWAMGHISTNGLEFVRIDDVAKEEFLRIHLAPERVNQLDLRELVVIPYYNIVNKAAIEEIAGVVTLYPDDGNTIQDDEILFLKFRLSQIEGMSFLQRKENVSSKMIDLFSRNTGGRGTDQILSEIVGRVIPETFSVEACSLYEWSTQKHTYVMAATTGINSQPNRRQAIDFRGAGLVGETAVRGTPLIINDLNSEEEIALATGQQKTKEEVFLNMEQTTHPAKTFMAVPIFNPAAPSEQTPMAIIRLVNKKCALSGHVDCFSSNDKLLAEEVVKVLALYEDHKRLERGQRAFALHFGHEAQAPAVGIKGTAERLLKHIDDQQFPSSQRISMLTDIQHFSELLISFSDSVTYGFADKAQSFKSKYQVRLQNLRNSIEQAKKVVIPTCRQQRIQFDNIKISGSFPEIYIDTRAFIQVFYNLFSNAIKYRDKQEGFEFAIYVTCAKTFIRVPFTDPSGGGAQDARGKIVPGYRVEVQDFGVGVPTAYRHKIFTEGYRVPEMAAMEIRGSGIGLSIVRNILEDFQCRISLSNNKDPTTFRILIPAALESRDFVNNL